MEFLKNAVKKYNDTSLILRIVIGLAIGAILGVTLKSWTWVGLLGTLFVGALRAIAPILVFVLIISALSTGQSKLDRKFGLVLFFYMFSTFLAAAAGVTASFLFISRCSGRCDSQFPVPRDIETRRSGPVRYCSSECRRGTPESPCENGGEPGVRDH